MGYPILFHFLTQLIGKTCTAYNGIYMYSLSIQWDDDHYINLSHFLLWLISPTQV